MQARQVGSLLQPTGVVTKNKGVVQEATRMDKPIKNRNIQFLFDLLFAKILPPPFYEGGLFWDLKIFSSHIVF